MKHHHGSCFFHKSTAAFFGELMKRWEIAIQFKHVKIYPSNCHSGVPACFPQREMFSKLTLSATCRLEHFTTEF